MTMRPPGGVDRKAKQAWRGRQDGAAGKQAERFLLQDDVVGRRMSLARQVAPAHGGQLNACRAPAGGVVCSLVLPAA